MYITKENIDKIVEELQLDDFNVYVDMKFFLKDICNPYRTSNLRYMEKLDIHRYFVDLHNYMSSYFNKPVYFVFSTEKVYINDIPNYKSEYYGKYFDDEERKEILTPTLEVFDMLKFSSITSGVDKFIDSSNTTLSSKDELGFIKAHHGDKTALVITRDKIFCGYSDMIVVDPYDLSSGELKRKGVPDYYKLILSIIGYKPYSIPGIPGIKEKTAMKIIERILDKGEYIYYNTTSRPQPLFPIAYEVIAEVSDIERSEYRQIMANWRYLN